MCSQAKQAALFNSSFFPLVGFVSLGLGLTPFYVSQHTILRAHTPSLQTKHLQLEGTQEEEEEEEGRFEEEGTQIPSPTKHARLEGTQEEEEEEEMDDETGVSASQEIDVSQLGTQDEQAALHNSSFTPLVGFVSLDTILFCQHTILACILNTHREKQKLG